MAQLKKNLRGDGKFKVAMKFKVVVVGDKKIRTIYIATNISMKNGFSNCQIHAFM